MSPFMQKINSTHWRKALQEIQNTKYYMSDSSDGDESEHEPAEIPSV